MDLYAARQPTKRNRRFSEKGKLEAQLKIDRVLGLVLRVPRNLPHRRVIRPLPVFVSKRPHDDRRMMTIPRELR